VNHVVQAIGWASMPAGRRTRFSPLVLQGPTRIFDPRAPLPPVYLTRASERRARRTDLVYIAMHDRPPHLSALLPARCQVGYDTSLQLISVTAGPVPGSPLTGVLDPLSFDVRRGTVTGAGGQEKKSQRLEPEVLSVLLV